MPCWGVTNPLITLINVVFPAPERPNKALIPLPGNDRSMSKSVSP
ncbi:hypothetical protein VCHENC02_2768A, partial [Vibrio harveyi]